MVTLENIQAKISKLQVQAEQLATKQKSGVLEKIQALMEKHGVTTSDIDAHTSGSRRGRKPGVKAVGDQPAVAAKYRDPKSGALWSGRGRAPAWIAGARDRSKFLIEENSQDSRSVEKAAKKTSKRMTGPQPPMYLDPKTGATWSGRGRAPAWIANVKDRTKFLIEGADHSVSKETAPSTKKTVAKKATAKRVASKKAASVKAVASKKAAPAKKAVTQKVAAKRASAVKSAATGRARKSVTAKKAPVSTMDAADVPQQSNEAVNAESAM